MSRYCHHCAGTIADEYIVADPDRDLLARYRVDGVATGEDSGDRVVHHSLPLGPPLRPIEIGIDRHPLLVRSHLLHQSTLRSKHHKGHPVERIRPSGEDRNRLVTILEVKSNLSPLRATDPVALGLLNRGRPVYMV